MSQQKLTIVPVTLHPEHKDRNSSISPATLPINICTIKLVNADVTFFNGVDERTIQTVLRELNHP
ncbi:hypothetical protein [Halalkalibacter alkalisediminis]|uniref:Transposase n=1 Tax=Halalkalibacter alkalisediminis TaxID=935616 RepID=A0ABV6NE24_9BACI